MLSKMTTHKQEVGVIYREPNWLYTVVDGIHSRSQTGGAKGGGPGVAARAGMVG
jgi:hypothetical protein